METKFTKGEWDAVIDNWQCWIDSDEGLVADLGHSDVPYQEAEANAHLIAASPEMYEMLERVCNELIPIAGETEKQESFRFEILDLLAEARGEHGNNA